MGDALISPAITVHYLDRYVGHRGPDAAAADLMSDRELDVAKAVARGLSNQEVAAELSSRSRPSSRISPTSSPSWPLVTASRSRSG